jgi:O-antigen ligase
MTFKNQITFLGISLFLVTILVDPIHLYDPINIPKFTTITIISVPILYFLIRNWRLLNEKMNRKILVLSLSFICWLLLITLVSKMNLIDSIYGVSGRQTGLITYLALNLLMLYAVCISGSELNLLILKVLLGTGYFSAIYGLFQILNRDPFDWINPYSNVFGLFGNPNFHSSFIALSAIAAITMIFSKIDSKSVKLLSWLYLPIAIVNIYFSKSLQGFLGLAAGICIIVYFKLIQGKFHRLKVPYILFILFGMIAVCLDIFQKSPWTPKLYKESISFRGDFWRAGLSITADNPIFGVGMDGYRDTYRQARDLVATNRNYNVMVDSAHNIFLDISSGGGIPLALIYICIQLLVIVSFFRLVKRKQNDMFVNGIFASWIVYQLQSLISINQIGIAVWGWTLGGVIIGYEIKTRKVAAEINTSKRSIYQSKNYVALSICLAVGITITTPVWKADAEFRGAFANGNVNKIVDVATQWPQSATKMNLASSILRQNGYEKEALVIARKTVEINPYNFEAWQELSLFSSLAPTEKNKILKTMKLLDPLNPTLP